MHHWVGILLYSFVNTQLGLHGLRFNSRVAVGKHKGGIYPVAEVESLVVHMHPCLISTFAA